MSAVFQFLALIAGLVALWGGTNLVLRGAIHITRRYGVSELFIGLTVIAIGTDLPELVVSIDSAFKNLQGIDTSGLIVGNAIGSALGNFGLVVGVAGLVGYLTLAERMVFVHGGILLISIIVLFIAGDDGAVTRAEGSAMVAAFIIYMVMAFKSDDRTIEEVERPAGAAWRYWLYLAGGIAIVLAGSELTIAGVLGLAESWGVRQSLVAIVIVGIGTSLPELSISVMAVLRKQGGLSVGNLIGSNIFNALIPVGVAGAIAPVQFEKSLAWFDLPYLMGLSLLVLILFRRTRGLQKPEALAILGIYGLYLALKFMRF